MNDESPKYVAYTSKPLTAEQLAELDALASRGDDEIDFSDIPEAGNEFFDNAKRGSMYRALKAQLTIRLDADILDWFKRHAKDGKGYQTDINKALRAYVTAQEKRAQKKAG
ncbi:BrnA antitoxin family protein [Devosia sp. ZW T5_3]|uniref:BrnA antitoxin family protein n=1 Tax=Devosia sp. ZW T5_3 TaxID=3378085 RepID=UPI0038537543